LTQTGKPKKWCSVDRGSAGATEAQAYADETPSLGVRAEQFIEAFAERFGDRREFDQQQVAR
jgi:hypothetical protein